jgi:sec-independent protein translocase protein TatB
MQAMAAEFRQGFDELARQAELDELRKEVEAMRRTVSVPDLETALAGPPPPPVEAPPDIPEEMPQRSPEEIPPDAIPIEEPQVAPQEIPPDEIPPESPPPPPDGPQPTRASS